MVGLWLISEFRKPSDDKERSDMGGENLFIIAALLGAAMFVYLAYRSLQSSTRAYALPTLAFSVGVGIWFAYDMPPHGYHIYFLVGFLLGAAAFHLHARAIKALLTHKDKDHFTGS
ncbi:hypothetical protein [Variovorax paradoxus]|jgi:hypothetical protein|uniref:hypothetical protein n=1 Tax=Variovorax paradoxus TaxID=34073 RepID=UPI0029C6BD92|nr:hypothetical protein [Variovorax paradoxus]WPH20808.1 hypothetical protein RZE78_01290 [Variovorax paradoxus]